MLEMKRVTSCNAGDKKTYGHRPLRASARACLGFAILAFFMATSACRRPVYSVETQGPFPPRFSEYRVLRNGQPVATFTPDTRARFTVTGGHFERATTTMSSLSVERLTPCGWRAAPAKADRHSDNETAYDLNVTEPEEDWQGLPLFVDNRHGGPARLAVGALEQSVDAGQYVNLDFVVSNACPEADQLKLNGQVIASVSEIESKRKDRDSLAEIFVDTTADHCYTYEWALYGESFLDQAVDGKEQLPARRVRLFEKSVDYYFQELPGNIQTQFPGAQQSRGALKDRACGR
jgi:hypothetical protein